ncbi:hypothetical protein ACFQY0_19795 [Haloferula chungangensis]|uniref:Uncharacterized protein n=1 Tax=Haloferula chungangensis TaxID=1048331 RepID=A0ABW2LD67_9BACT
MTLPFFRINHFFGLFLGMLGLLSSGCKESSNIDNEISKWESSGWKFEEAVGSQIPDAIYISHISSPTASKVTAFSHINSEGPLKKSFAQDDRNFLLVTMGHEAHGNFSLVFSKLKPTEPQSSTAH